MQYTYIVCGELEIINCMHKQWIPGHSLGEGYGLGTRLVHVYDVYDVKHKVAHSPKVTYTSTAGKSISRGSRGSTRAKPEVLSRLPREIIFPKVDNGSYTPLRSGLSILYYA